jgi:hypothetical protein
MPLGSLAKSYRQPAHRPNHRNHELDGEHGARRLLDAELQQEPSRREAEEPHDQHEQDHVAEGDHAGRGLRDVGRHEQLIERYGDKTADVVQMSDVRGQRSDKR